jgi:hypothetical protein
MALLAQPGLPTRADEPIRQSEVPAEDGGEILLIGSASTLQREVDSDSEGSSNEFSDEDSVDLSIALQIATASMSHVSPLFYWMAEPTTAYARPSSPPAHRTKMATVGSGVEDPIAAKSDRRIRPIVLPPDPTELIEALNDEPPRMVTSSESSRAKDIELGPIDTGDTTTTRSSRLSQQTLPSNLDLPKPDTKTESAGEPSNSENSLRKPPPRKVRLPFETQESEPPSNATSLKSATNGVQVPEAKPEPAKIVSRETDSQRDQEEPQLDPRDRGNGREHQGVDALKAVKPQANRREVRIDDVSSKRDLPNAPRFALDPATAMRLQRADQCFAYYLNNPESTSVRSPWAVMHAVLAYGGEYEMVHGNGRVNAIGWMCHNGTCRTQRMFTPRGKGFVPNVGGGVQGHEGQFLAILAQCNVPLDYPIQIGTTKFKVEDLVRYEMATCKEKSELTFKLIGLSYYLDTNKQWRSNDGKVWSIPKLIQEEMSQPIIGSACGGTHRLMGFSFSVRQRQLQGQPVNGQYARAAKFVRDYVAYTLQLQNPDGSFSTNWYEGRGNEPNEERKVQTSGHMLEWLLFTMTDDEVKSPKVAKGIDFLLSKIYDKREYKWPIGPRGHATRAITLYRDRMQEIAGSTSDREAARTAVKTPPAPAPIINR